MLICWITRARAPLKRTAIITGTGAALFWPCSLVRQYAPLLGCLYLLAFGLAFLECSANPWIVLLAERRRRGAGTAALNLAQSFNPLGAVGGVLIGRQAILGAEGVASPSPCAHMQAHICVRMEWIL